MAQWGMVIDLNRCDGCGACEIACQVENNIPVAGREAAEMGRSLSWIRIERTTQGRWPDLATVFRPVLCQHCDEAPCVPVCPLGATWEDSEGLNRQSQSRCAGVLSCAGACPYHVRQFNAIEPQWPASHRDHLNPDVPPRERGHVEKCTFCIHRIRRAKTEAASRGRPLADGDVTPACAQACPSRAIVFGDLDDPASRVSRMASSARASRLGEEHGTGPRVVYLARAATAPSDGDL